MGRGFGGYVRGSVWWCHLRGICFRRASVINCVIAGDILGRIIKPGTTIFKVIRPGVHYKCPILLLILSILLHNNKSSPNQYTTSLISNLQNLNNPYFFLPNPQITNLQYPPLYSPPKKINPIKIPNIITYHPPPKIPTHLITCQQQ